MRSSKGSNFLLDTGLIIAAGLPLKEKKPQQRSDSETANISHEHPIKVPLHLFTICQVLYSL